MGGGGGGGGGEGSSCLHVAQDEWYIQVVCCI